jgi:gamma-glutamyltranspeptidase/glutathione hydrolase
VASAEADATAIGIEILRQGGNAVDAAVATALALAVVHPEAGNLGGGGFAVVRLAGRVYALDFRETAPAAARRDMFLDRSGEPRPGASTLGPLAAGVPGSPHGYWELHWRFGQLPWASIVAPSIQLAREGFLVSERLERSLNKRRQALLRFSETGDVWLKDGLVPAAGARIVLPDLASTLEAYARVGPKGIVEGSVAASVLATSRRYGGILTSEDLALYRPLWREPLKLQIFGWEAFSLPLPSSGGVILGQTSALLERLGWDQLPTQGVERAHLLAEAFRRSYADRVLLGDPSSSHARPQDLLDPLWLKRLTASIQRDRATPSDKLTGWPGQERQETTHLSVVDKAGNLVALTTTLNGSYGCKLYVPGAGFFLNNEMDDFTTAPGLPNAYGLIQGEANTVAPARRMLSSQSPTLVLDRDGDKDRALALGGRGGSRIPSHVLQVILGVVVDGESLESAVERPRLHHQWQPDRLHLETQALDAHGRQRLVDMGHTIELDDPREDSAKVHAVAWEKGGVSIAAADFRGPGVAAVVQPDEANPVKENSP